MSRIDSPRVSCISSGRRTIGCPPSSKTPDSNDVRVRVDGLLNTSATVLPSSAREESGASLSRAARWSNRESLSASSSAPVMKCWGAGIDLEPLPRTESRALRDFIAQRVRERPGELGMGRGAAAGGAAVVAAAARRGDALQRAPRAHLTQLRAPDPAGDQRAQPGHPQSQRRRRERDPRARPDPRPGRLPTHLVARAPLRPRRAQRPRLDRQPARLDAQGRVGAPRRRARPRRLPRRVISSAAI